MTSVISDILNAVKSMISKFESLIREAISTLASKGEAIASDIKTESEAIFTDIRTKMSNAIQQFKARLENKKSVAGTPGTSATTFASRIHNALRDLVSDLQGIFDRFKSIVKDILSDAEKAIKDVEGKLGPIVKDTVAFTDTATRDFLHALKAVAVNVETALAKGGAAVIHNIEADASFVKNHGLQIAEAATISIIQPSIILSFVASGAMIYAGAIYQPSK